MSDIIKKLHSESKEVEDSIANAERSFEEGRLRYILSTFGVSPQKMRNEARQLTGEPILTCPVFNQLYPDFPLFLGIRRWKGLSGEKNLQPSKVLKALDKTPVVRVFKNFATDNEHLNDSRPFGLILPMAGYSQGILVHDNFMPQSEGPAWAVLSRRKSHEYLIWVEPFLRVLKTWKSEKAW